MLVKLGNYLDIKRGPGLPSENYATEGSLIRLTLGNFNYPNGGFKNNASKQDIYYSGNVKKEYILKKGDLITPLTEQVEGLLGETAWIPEDDKYIQNGDIGLVIPFENVLDKKYCYYLLSSYIIKNQLSAGAQQTKIRHTSPEKIKDCVAPIPSVDYQRKIGNILYEIDAQIKRNNEMVQKLQVLTQSIYSYWFNQFEFPNEEGKPYKSSGGKMVWNEKLKREIPKDWTINTVKNYCNITWGQCPDGINILPLSYNDENTILYCSGAGDMRNGIVVDCQAKTNASKRLAHKNDILMSIAGSIGALCICDKTISLGRAAVAFTQKENQSLLTYQLINVFATRMKSVSSGSIQKVINDNHLNDIKFAFSKEIFELYTSKFNSILEVIINFEHKNKELVHLKEKMLPLLINGQLI